MFGGIRPDFFTRTRVKVDEKAQEAKTRAANNKWIDFSGTLISQQILEGKRSFAELKDTIHTFFEMSKTVRNSAFNRDLPKFTLFPKNNHLLLDHIHTNQTRNIKTLLDHAKSPAEVDDICQVLKNQIETSFKTQARQFLANKGIPHDHINQLTTGNLEQLFDIIHTFKDKNQTAVWNLVKDICAMNNYNGSDTLIEHFHKAKSLEKASELCERFKATKHMKNSIANSIIKKFKLDNPENGNNLALNLLKTLSFEQLVAAAEDSSPKSLNNLIVELLEKNYPVLDIAMTKGSIQTRTHDQKTLKSIFSFLATLHTTTGLEKTHSKEIENILDSLLNPDKRPNHFNLFLTIVETFGSDPNQDKFKFIHTLFQITLQENTTKSEEILDAIITSKDITNISSAIEFLDSSKRKMTHEISQKITESPFQETLLQSLQNASLVEILTIHAHVAENPKSATQINTLALNLFLKQSGIHDGAIAKTVLKASKANLEIVFSALAKIGDFTAGNSVKIKNIILNFSELSEVSPASLEKIKQKISDLTDISDILVFSKLIKTASPFAEEIIAPVLSETDLDSAQRRAQNYKDIYRLHDKTFPEIFQHGWVDFKSTEPSFTPQEAAAHVHFFSLISEYHATLTPEQKTQEQAKLDGIRTGFVAAPNKVKFLTSNQDFIDICRQLIHNFMQAQLPAETDFGLNDDSMSNEEVLLAARQCSYLKMRDKQGVKEADFRKFDDDPVLALDLFSYYRPNEKIGESKTLEEAKEAGFTTLLAANKDYTQHFNSGNIKQPNTIFRTLGYRDDQLVMYHPVIQFLTETAASEKKFADFSQEDRATAASGNQQTFQFYKDDFRAFRTKSSENATFVSELKGIIGDPLRLNIRAADGTSRNNLFGS